MIDEFGNTLTSKENVVGLVSAVKIIVIWMKFKTVICKKNAAMKAVAWRKFMKIAALGAGI